MDVDLFMEQLRAQTAPANKSFKAKGRVLEKISLNFEGNFGRYMVLPMNSVVLDYPFIKMDGTREICVPRKNVAQDGTESTYNAWIKLLPKDAYKFLDINGRITSSLTAADDQLLSEAYTVFDQLYNEIDAKNNQQISRNLMRKRNYTIFNAYCCNFWASNNSGNPRDPQRSKFCGLFVATAKGFMNAVEENISSNNIIGNGEYNWLEQIYGRQQSGRTGYMLFNIGRNKESGMMGYTVSVDNRFDCGSVLSGYSITDEEAEMMQDPVLNFLGWQAGHEDDELPVANRRLFNTILIKEAIDYMTKQLAGVRSAKESGASIEDAIKATSESVALEKNTSYIPKNNTNDPMLKTNNVVPPTTGISQEEVMARNTNPFQTPAAAKMDPITGSPVSNNNPSNMNGFGGFAGSGPANNGTPFKQPEFTKFGSGNNQPQEGDLPF